MDGPAGGTESSREVELSERQQLLLVSLQPLWDKTSFSLELAWLISKKSYHELVDEDRDIPTPSPSWLTDVDRLEVTGVISCESKTTLSFVDDPRGLLKEDLLSQPRYIKAVDDAFFSYMMHWATQTAMLNELLRTSDAEEGAEYYAKNECHFMTLFDFMLERFIKFQESSYGEDSADILHLLHRISFVMGGHLCLLCRWILSPMLGLALCECVSQILSICVPDISYYGALFDIGSSSVADTDSPPQGLPSRAYISARIDLAVQLRLHGQHEECVNVLNNSISIVGSFPDFNDVPCILMSHAVCQLAITQLEFKGKLQAPEIDSDIEAALSIDLSVPLDLSIEKDTTEAFLHGTLALFHKVLSFCESYPRGVRQNPEILSLKGNALLGLMRLLTQYSEYTENSSTSFPRLKRSESAKFDSEAMRGYLEIAEKCFQSSLSNPYNLHLFLNKSAVEHDEPNTVEEISAVFHPQIGEVFLHWGEFYKALGDLDSAKKAYIRALKIFSRFSCCCSPVHLQSEADKEMLSSTSDLSLLCHQALNAVTRPNVFLARSFCSLGLVLDELDDFEDAHACYSSGKHIHKLMFGDDCLPAADASVNKAMLFLNENCLRQAQKELTEALRIYMFRFGYDNSDTREIQCVLDNINTKLMSERSMDLESKAVKPNELGSDRVGSGRNEILSNESSENLECVVSPQRKRQKKKLSLSHKRNTVCRHYFRKQRVKYREIHKVIVEMRNPVSELSSRSDVDIKDVNCDPDSYQQTVDSLVTEVYILKIFMDKSDGDRRRVSAYHRKIAGLLQRAIQLAREWEYYEIKLRKGDDDIRQENHCFTPHGDLETGPLDQDGCGITEVALDECHNRSSEYIVTSASTKLAALLLLEADHITEYFLRKSSHRNAVNEPKKFMGLIKAISEKTQEAICIYKACLGSSNLMVANAMVHYASHMLGFVEYTSNVFSALGQEDSKDLNEQSSYNIFQSFQYWLSFSESQQVLPVRVKKQSIEGLNKIRDNDTIKQIETLHSRCLVEAKELLDESLILFEVLKNSELDDPSCQFNIVLLPSHFSEKLCCKDNTTEYLRFRKSVAIPMHGISSSVRLRTSLPPRGYLEANMLLAHVYLYQDEIKLALDQCNSYLSQIKYIYACSQSDLPHTVKWLSAPSATGLDAMRCALRMQELEQFLSTSTDKSTSLENGNTLKTNIIHNVSHCAAHSYVAEAYFLKAQVIQSFGGSVIEMYRKEAQECLLSALLVYRRLFGDKDEQFIWMERSSNVDTNAETAVMYCPDVYISEGGCCGVTIELAKMYIALADFYQEQDAVMLAIDMNQRALTVLCELNLLPSTTENIGPKVGFVLCNLGDMLTAENRLEEAEKMYSIARDVYERSRKLIASKWFMLQDRMISSIASPWKSSPLDQSTHFPLYDNKSTEMREESEADNEGYLEEISYIDSMLKSLDFSSTPPENFSEHQGNGYPTTAVSDSCRLM